MKNIRVAYLHGLESKGYGQKNDWLREKFVDVLDPIIDYKKNNIFSYMFSMVKEFNPNIIVGSSMGGRFSYHISNHLKCNTILFNPALVSNNPLVNSTKIIEYNGRLDNYHNVILGEKDLIVDPIETEKYLRKNAKNNYSIRKFSHGHRTPYKIFTKILSEL